MRIKLIACEVFFRELCHVLARATNQVDVEFLPKGLHDLPSGLMSGRLQERIDAVEPGRYDRIVMAYGLCNNGTSGLVARHTPLVIPRGHDCITVFLGDRTRYARYFADHPGTYFLTSGWIERGENGSDLSQLSVARKSGMDMTYAELVEKYGEENAAFLHETLHTNKAQHYGHYTFIEMGVEPDGRFRAEAERRATAKGWTFSHEAGDMSVIAQLVDGPWADDIFLNIAPGSRLAPSFNDDIVKAV
jgi:hypothetical protein